MKAFDISEFVKNYTEEKAQCNTLDKKIFVKYLRLLSINIVSNIPDSMKDDEVFKAEVRGASTVLRNLINILEEGTFDTDEVERVKGEIRKIREEE